MAKARFRFAIGPRGRAPGSAIRVGDPVTGTVVVQTPKRHTQIELVYALGWTATGRKTDSATVARGRIPIAAIEADTPEVFRFDAEIPAHGPATYRGELLSVGWFLEVSLDIPWAFDPDGSVGFVVHPRRELAIKLLEHDPALDVRATPTSTNDVCPFCKDTVEDDRWVCPACNTVHHDECHELYGRCTIPGCSG